MIPENERYVYVSEKSKIIDRLTAIQAELLAISESLTEEMFWNSETCSRGCQVYNQGLGNPKGAIEMQHYDAVSKIKSSADFGYVIDRLKTL
jgi:hypothetical protein